MRVQWHVTQALDVLDKFKIIGRSETRIFVDQLLKRNNALNSDTIIARFSPNSGNFVGMILEQERRDDYSRLGVRFARGLGELEQMLLAKPAQIVLFLDDQFATGAQAHAQLLEWSGKPRADWPEELQAEQNIDKTILGAETQKIFEKGTTIFGFAYGSREGKERILQVAKNEGFSGISVQYGKDLGDHSIPMSAELSAFLEDVGEAVLETVRFSGRLPTTKERTNLKKDALGYGGKKSFLVTPFGAPSHTITAFWCPGKFQGEAWVPIFLRRGYRQHLVFS